MPGDKERKCEVCQKDARQFCASCKSVFYCSRDCQKQDWKRHKPLCRPYTIQTHPIYGRYMVSSRDIKAGEIILRESPLVVGPKQSTIPLCLGCHKKIIGKETYVCTKCKYPLCGKLCETSNLHKSECPILEKNPNPVKVTNFESPDPAYECITPLRCLLLQTTNSKNWETLTQLQSHEEDIKKTDIFSKNQKNIVEYIRFPLGWSDADPTTIHKICGILMTNGFELMHNKNRVRGIYYYASFLAHDCVPNTKHTFDDDLNIIFRTTVAVPRGSPLTNTYTQTLWNTLSRRYQLKLSQKHFSILPKDDQKYIGDIKNMAAKFFLCGCNRCKDPTELGTDMSTLICTKCGGHVQSTEPLSLEADWACLKCENRLLGKQVHWGDQQLYQELLIIGRKTPNELESFLERYKQALHPKHRFFVETKYALIKYYGNFPECPYKELSREQIENKVNWCKELLELADIIDPGKSLLRGTVLLELQAGLVAMAKYLISNDLITQEEAGGYMNEAVGYLQEASEILKHEPHMANGGLDDKLSWLSKELEI